MDLTIDGHDHDNPDCIPELNLYAPKTFSKSMFEMDLQIRDNVKKIMNVKEIESDNLPVSD